MVRVLIERRVPEGMAGDFLLALRQMRFEAVHRPGYVSGETWRDAADPLRFIVISTWTSRQAWDAWVASDARSRTMALLGPMIDGPEEITVLEPV
ncbi:MAG: antibiotic biosynthesis monooxygenase [Deferrisomatales bacterium]|nr:antibiotic biosynthesis monooxygenase [Deferrisomatales bacterium]